MATVIGIPPGFDAREPGDPPDRKGLRPGRATHYLDAALAAALHEQGAIPLLLPGPAGLAPDAAPIDADRLEQVARAALAPVDALLIPGGDDFEPDARRDPPLPLTPVSAAQLAFDEALARVALERGLPILGLCYGMQLLARLAGGRLVYHLPSECPEAGEHQRGHHGAPHWIRIEAGSRLAAWLGALETEVNSRHHQAVAEPGPGYRVTARADDGVVEAIEATGPALVLGVQWHPEDLDATHRRALFGHFVAAAAGAD